MQETPASSEEHLQTMELLSEVRDQVDRLETFARDIATALMVNQGIETRESAQKNRGRGAVTGTDRGSRRQHVARRAYVVLSSRFRELADASGCRE